MVRKHRSVTGREKKKHFPIIVHGRLPPLICLSGDSMDFLFFFTPLNGVFVLSAIPVWPPTPSPQPSDFYKIHLRWNRGVCLKITFYSPHLHLGSSRWQLASQFIMSLLEKGCKGPGRSSHHISLSRPVSEIITGTDKLPGSYFLFIYFYSALLYETGRCYGHTDPGFRTRVRLSSSLTRSHAPALRQRSPGLSKASPHIVSFITVTGFKVKTIQTFSPSSKTQKLCWTQNEHIHMIVNDSFWPRFKETH